MAQKGDSKSVHRQVEGRLDDQDTGADRRARQSGPLRALAGHRYDTVAVAPLIADVEFGALIADKAFDSNWIIADLNERGAGIVISQRPQRTQPLTIDEEIYKWRHLIENFFCKLKEFKRIAMRACNTDKSFESLIYLCSAVIRSR
jgi:transposase